jgi:hypothetical protein
MSPVRLVDSAALASATLTMSASVTE